MSMNTASQSWAFLSTPSARRATHVYAVLCGDWKFLSTPSARRATAGLGRTPAKLKLFLSTPSARRATPQPERD